MWHLNYKSLNCETWINKFDICVKKWDIFSVRRLWHAYKLVFDAHKLYLKCVTEIYNCDDNKCGRIIKRKWIWKQRFEWFVPYNSNY